MNFEQYDSRRAYELEQELEVAKKTIKGSGRIFPNKKTMYAFLNDGLEGYTLEFARTKTDAVDSLGLSWRKVAELYSVPINAVETVFKALWDGNFIDAIKWSDDANGLVIDEKVAKEIIKDLSDVRLTKKQNDFVKQLAKVEREYIKLYDYTENPQLMIRFDERRREWEPSISWIKYYIK